MEKGKKHTDETRKKMSVARLGIKYPYRKRHPRSLETKKKISVSNTGRKRTDEQKLNISKGIHEKSINRGEKHWNWQGGINSPNDSLRKSFAYKMWRNAVFIRDNFCCVLCKRKAGGKRHTHDRVVLNADHIKPFALFPALRFEISNGRTLCVPCHRQTESYGVNFNRYNINSFNYIGK